MDISDNTEQMPSDSTLESPSWASYFRQPLQSFRGFFTRNSSTPPPCAEDGARQQLPADVRMNDHAALVPITSLSQYGSASHSNIPPDSSSEGIDPKVLSACTVESYKLMAEERKFVENNVAMPKALCFSTDNPSSSSQIVNVGFQSEAIPYGQIRPSQQFVHHGDNYIQYPLEQVIKQDKENKSKIVKEISLKLKNRYKRLNIPWTPWMKDAQFSLEKYFVDLRMYQKNYIGRILPEKIIGICEFFGDDEDVYRVIVEGNPGYGKTVLCCKLAYDWANGEEYLAHFKLVILLQLRYLDCMLHEAIYEEIRMTGYDQQTLLDAFEFVSDEVLLILDGYDELPACNSYQEILPLFSQTMYASTTVVMTTRPHVTDTARLHETCQNRVVIMGMNAEQQRDFIRHSDLEGYKAAKIRTIVNAPDTKELFQCPLLFILLCFLVDDSEISCDKISTLYMEMFNYMVRNSLYKVEDHKVDLFNDAQAVRHPKQVYSHLVEFGKLALESLLKNKLTFTESDIEAACGNLEITRLGFLNKTAKVNHWRTVKYYEPVHKTFLEFLAACYVENQSFCDSKEFLSLCRKVLLDGVQSAYPIFNFLVGLLRDRATLLYDALPVHYLMGMADAGIIDQSPNTPEIMQSLSRHMPRTLNMSCSVKFSDILINYWYYIENIGLLQYHKNLKEQLHVTPCLLVHLDIKENETEDPALKNSDIDDMPLTMQFTAHSLVERDVDRSILKLREFPCEKLEIEGFYIFEDKFRFLYLTLATVITQMCPKELTFFGITWKPEGVEDILMYLVSEGFKLQKFVLEDHSIISHEHAEIIGDGVHKMQVSHFVHTYKMLVTESQYWLPIYKKLLGSCSALTSLSIVIDSQLTEITQEFIDSLVMLIEHTDTLTEFAFLETSVWYHTPVLTFNLCAMCCHGKKNLKQLRFERAAVTVECLTCNSLPATNFLPGITTLEIISAGEDFGPQDAISAILRCENLTELTCDALVARDAYQIPANWSCFTSIERFCLVVISQTFPQCWLFVNQFKKLRTLCLDFRESSKDPGSNLSRFDWLSFLNVQMALLETLEVKIRVISSQLRGVMETFAGALMEASGNLKLSRKPPSVVLHFQKKLPFSGEYVQPDQHILPLKVTLQQRCISDLQIWFRNFDRVDAKVIFNIENLFPNDEGFCMNITRENTDDYIIKIFCDPEFEISCMEIA